MNPGEDAGAAAGTNSGFSVSRSIAGLLTRVWQSCRRRNGVQAPRRFGVGPGRRAAARCRSRVSHWRAYGSMVQCSSTCCRIARRRRRHRCHHHLPRSPGPSHLPSSRLAATTPAPPAILVVGSLNLDIIVHVDRLPAQDETIMSAKPTGASLVPARRGLLVGTARREWLQCCGWQHIVVQCMPHQLLAIHALAAESIPSTLQPTWRWEARAPTRRLRQLAWQPAPAPCAL